MGIHRTYYCDLCRKWDKPDNLFGIYWVSNNKVEVRPSEGVEHHLCKKCIEEIKKISFDE